VPRQLRRQYLLAFSCKSRWFCPSCHQRKVQTTADFIANHVLAPVPHRHYVLAIPKMLRPYFQRHRCLLKNLCTLARESLTEYLRVALDLPKGIPGIVMTIHTFGEYLDFHLRNPFSVEKMTMESPTDNVIYRSRMSVKINRNFEIFSPADFLAAITQHIPDKGVQMVRYYGWYSNKMRGGRQPSSALDATSKP